MKLEAFDSSYFYDKIFFGNDGFQNMFGCQLTFNMSELKIGKREYVTGWTSKGLF